MCRIAHGRGEVHNKSHSSEDKVKTSFFLFAIYVHVSLAKSHLCDVTQLHISSAYTAECWVEHSPNQSSIMILGNH